MLCPYWHTDWDHVLLFVAERHDLCTSQWDTLNQDPTFNHRYQVRRPADNMLSSCWPANMFARYMVLAEG